MMDALDRATVAKLRECAAMLNDAAELLLRYSWKGKSQYMQRLAKSANSLADDIERAEAGK